MDQLAPWIERQYRHAAGAMLKSISPVAIVKSRPGFGQTIRPRKGAVVASPVLAAYDPDPDYFFHWYRDSAVIMDALRLLFLDGRVGPEALEHLSDFVAFSRSLAALDGRSLVARPGWRAAVAADFARFVRTDADLGTAHGAAIAAETRVNADGSLDISNWPRPQHDGPALRALTLLRWLRTPLAAPLEAALSALIESDLSFLAAHWRQPSYDIWEEELGQHYYTLCVAAAALAEGAAWRERRGARGDNFARDAADIRAILDGFWLEEAGYYRSRVLSGQTRSKKELDIAVILAAVHTDLGAAHSVRDPRMHATLERLEALFEVAYPINQGREPDTAPAMGRYHGDVYYSGGAYYFSTLGAAEFCYRAAAELPERDLWLRHGDAFLATVRAHTPATGELSEQFDQRSGAQTSAKELAWSYASFISCVHARRAAQGRSP